MDFSFSFENKKKNWKFFTIHGNSPCITASPPTIRLVRSCCCNECCDDDDDDMVVDLDWEIVDNGITVVDVDDGSEILVKFIDTDDDDDDEDAWR